MLFIGDKSSKGCNPFVCVLLQYEGTGVEISRYTDLLRLRALL